MSLQPLFSASPAIYVHAVLAMAAFCLGIVQLFAPKGVLAHRILGWLWVLIMGGVAATSFMIHQLRVWGQWSPIHLLSIFTLASLALGVWRARMHDVKGHRAAMIGLFAGALVVAGLFTLLPGRIMHEVVFGGARG